MQSPPFYIRPVGLLDADTSSELITSGAARPLAGGCRAFTHCAVTGRGEDQIVAVSALGHWGQTQGLAAPVEHVLTELSRPRPAIAGLVLDGRRPLIMGIVNVTPDSFSDGGDHDSPRAAIEHGERLLAEGADILDIGGESTRPGAQRVPPDIEAARVLPVVTALANKGAIVSIDTRKAAVMAAALDHGAVIINDVSALTHEVNSLTVAAKSNAPVILMHMRGDPATMQDSPRYDSVLTDVYDYLHHRIMTCRNAGIDGDRIIIDPGIGFGKTLDHNAALLSGLALFHGLGCPLLVGVSRKRFVAALSRGEAPKDRLPGSLAAGLAAIGQGAQILRVHDVGQTRQALSVWNAVLASC